MKKQFFLTLALIVCVSMVASAEVYFSEDFDGYASTQAAVDAGWELIENEFVTEVGSNFVIAPFWPEGQDGPGTSTGNIYPPGADGMGSDSQYLMADSDAGSGSDDIGSQAAIWAISPVFSTVGASEVWFHADAEIENNNNGECLMLFQVTVDGGATWLPVWTSVEPERIHDDQHTAPDANTAEMIDGWPVLGSADNTKTYDGLHGRWHIQFPAEVANQAEVQFRIGYYEPADAWWIALDNIVVDNESAPMGEEEVLSEDFENGIPSTWTNASLSGSADLTQTWDTRCLWDAEFDEPLKFKDPFGGVNVDYVQFLNTWGIEDVQAYIADPDDQLTPRAALDGRFFYMLAGQGYAMWQEGNEDADVGQVSGLDTPVLDLSDAVAAYLAFDSELLVGSGDAVYEVQVSVDGGASFETIFTYHGALMNYEEAPYFMRHYLEIPQAAGQSQVVVRFYAQGADPGEMEGFWVIDNVSVTKDAGTAVSEWALF
jgi:hypothetical protein